MPSDMLAVVGWDIGGVNIKAGRPIWQNKEIANAKAVSQSFEIWLKHERLSETL